MSLPTYQLTRSASAVGRIASTHQGVGEAARANAAVPDAISEVSECSTVLSVSTCWSPAGDSSSSIVVPLLSFIVSSCCEAEGKAAR